jgi:site-specific DNA-methyltransferase (adenine-specific)
LTDAIQWAGWLWRGVIVWDKVNPRPQPHRPKQQCEFIAWASKGLLDIGRDAPYLPGLFAASPPSGNNRYHQTEKPQPLMSELVGICVRNGVVLDPFCGSGTTLAAAAQSGRSYIGIEIDPEFCNYARHRAADAENVQISLL